MVKEHQCTKCGARIRIETPDDWSPTLPIMCIDCDPKMGWHPVKPLGTPLSELSGRPGHPGYEKFKSIAASWGHD